MVRNYKKTGGDQIAGNRDEETRKTLLEIAIKEPAKTSAKASGLLDQRRQQDANANKRHKNR